MTGFATLVPVTSGACNYSRRSTVARLASPRENIRRYFDMERDSNLSRNDQTSEHPSRHSVRELYRMHFQNQRRERQFLASVSFFGTFLLVRLIVRSIQKGKGPFHNVSAGGKHIHHLVFGISALLLVGLLWLAQIGTGMEPPRRRFGRGTAVLYGAGSALTLDEFALWLNLSDVVFHARGTGKYRRGDWIRLDSFDRLLGRAVSPCTGPQVLWKAEARDGLAFDGHEENGIERQLTVGARLNAADSHEIGLFHAVGALADSVDFGRQDDIRIEVHLDRGRVFAVEIGLDGDSRH